MTCGWSAGLVLGLQTPDELFHTTVGVYSISVVSGDRTMRSILGHQPPASKYPTRRRAGGFGRSHGGGRRQATVRIGAVLQQNERPWWSVVDGMVAVVDWLLALFGAQKRALPVARRSQNRIFALQAQKFLKSAGRAVLAKMVEEEAIVEPT